MAGPILADTCGKVTERVKLSENQNGETEPPETPVREKVGMANISESEQASIILPRIRGYWRACGNTILRCRIWEISLVCEIDVIPSAGVYQTPVPTHLHSAERGKPDGVRSGGKPIARKAQISGGYGITEEAKARSRKRTEKPLSGITGRDRPCGRAERLLTSAWWFSGKESARTT